MPDNGAIQFDAAFLYQQAALSATYRALCQTHDEAFATFFVDEYKDQVLLAARTRLCAQSEAAVVDATRRLRGVQQPRRRSYGWRVFSSCD